MDIHQAIKDYHALQLELRAETDQCIDKMRSFPVLSSGYNEWARRMIKEFFSEVDGSLGAIKSMVLVWAEMTGTALTEEERLILQGRPEPVKYGKDSFRDATKIPLLDNIKITFTIGANAHNSPFRINTGADARWPSFRKAVRIRDELIHPKSVEARRITIEKMEIITQAMAWWTDQHMALFRAVVAAADEYRKGIDAE